MSPPAPEEIKRTTGSGAENMTSERHCGQINRSRHANLHFHTINLLLKTLGSEFTSYISFQPRHVRDELWKMAVSGGNGCEKNTMKKRSSNNSLKRE